MINPLLQHYVKLTEFLGYVLGPDYEIVLHDLTDKNKSIIAIANPDISGRKIGSPPTHALLKLIKNKGYENQDYYIHYTGPSINGKKLRSSTLFIKHNNKLVGMLCINFDDTRFQDVSDQLLKLCHPDAFFETHFQLDKKRLAEIESTSLNTELYPPTSDAVPSDAVQHELLQLGLTAERLTQEERLKIIATLEANGIFLLKGAVKEVSEALKCSQASIYRYISQINKNRES